MYPEKSLFTKAIMNILGATLTLVSVLGNGFVLVAIARFKSLRTVPNILIANLAMVDLLHAAVNLPFHMISNSEASWYRGQTLAVVTAFLSRVFAILNLASMLAVLANVFLAIAFDLKYLAWKTKKKAMLCVVLIWLTSLVVTILGSIPLLNINLAEARVRDYRAEFYKQGKYFVGTSFAFSILCVGGLSFLTTCAIKKNKKKRTDFNLPPLQVEARLRSDIKATKTIVITIVGFFLCYVPAIIYGVWGHQKGTAADMWFGFFAFYSLYFSSALNPIVYYFRSSRFRSAFKHFLKDPFGSSDFKEKPTDRNEAEKQKGEDMSRMGDGKRKGDDGELVVHNDGNQTRHDYSVQQKNDVMVLAIENLQVRPFFRESSESKEQGETQEPSGSACERKLSEKNEKPTTEKSEEVPRECAFRANKFRKQIQRSSRGNMWLLRITPLTTTRQPPEAIRATDAHCAKNKIVVQSSLSVSNTPKVAWINNEERLEGKEEEEKEEFNSHIREEDEEEMQQLKRELKDPN